MPFTSKAQMRAAFATGGFGGAIDPEEWAAKTKGKKLPERIGKGSPSEDRELVRHVKKVMKGKR